MLKPSVPLNEEARLLDLYAHQILDTDKDEDFNDLVEMAAEICECPISQISFVDRDRQWFKAGKGIEQTETSRDISFCGHTILGEDLFVVEDASKDQRFADNPLVTDGLKVNFYTGAPILSSSGHALGAICVLDQKPRTLTAEQQQHLKRLSRQVSRLLELKLKARLLEDYAWKLEEQSEKYRKAKEEAEKASLVKSRFLSTMSHEIRTPMNAVIGFTHLLTQTARPDQTEYLGVLKYSAQNLLSLINDILDFSKIEEGKINFENIPFSLTDLLRNIEMSFQQLAKEKGLDLILNTNSPLPEFIKGDQVRLGQVLSNLVNNALKFTAEGSITLGVSVLKTNQKSTRLLFEVKDTGIGIPKSQQEKVFEVFTQASSDTTRKYGGSGLGLAIVRKLLELQGSNIKLESEEGKGSRFYFEMEFQRHTAIVSKSAKKEQKPNLALKGTRVLVVEDNPINVLLAKQFLKQWQVDCDVATNGIQAVEAVQKTSYDMVLMDLQMPEMDGFQATEAIRQLGEKYKMLPIIALTASALQEERNKVFSVGMNDFITKPFQPEELHNKISYYKNAS